MGAIDAETVILFSTAALVLSIIVTALLLAGEDRDTPGEEECAEEGEV